jgi:DNA repair exonuclease SbcCD ATPase subunit
MKLQSLRITGFGRLADTRFVFGPGLNVIVGSNEAGKSTLASAIVASLYGLQRGEKERWRPWAETEYATVLTYETGDGATWEVHRAFDRDSKGLRVFDGGGNDVAARIGNGKALNPGDVHLQIPLDVFLQTACIRQGAVRARRRACRRRFGIARASARRRPQGRRRHRRDRTAR